MPLIGFEKSVKLLKQYGFPVAKTKMAESLKEAMVFGKKTGFPLVLKVFSPNILHKSDVGGVKTGIKDEKELKKAFEAISKLGKVLIQEEVKGTEMSLGMKKDPAFGPVLMAGLGGIFVEILKDVSFRIAPVTRKEALEMMKSLKAWPVLQGCRGRKGMNVQALADILFKLSELSLKEENIKEIDFNPVMVDEKKAKIVDFKFLA